MSIRTMTTTPTEPQEWMMPAASKMQEWHKIEIEDVDSDDEDDDLKEQMAQRYGERMHDHDLQPHKPHDYSHLYSDLEHTMLTQYNIKKGLKLFGEAGMSAEVMKMQQLYDREVIIPKHTSMLTHKEKQQLL